MRYSATAKGTVRSEDLKLLNVILQICSQELFLHSWLLKLTLDIQKYSYYCCSTVIQESEILPPKKYNIQVLQLVIISPHTILQALKKFRLTTRNFGVFEPRYYHFLAYYNMIRGRHRKAQHLLNKAFIRANKCGCLYDVEWCLRSKNSWFPKTTFGNLLDDNEDTVFMFEFSFQK